MTVQLNKHERSAFRSVAKGQLLVVTRRVSHSRVRWGVIDRVSGMEVAHGFSITKSRALKDGAQAKAKAGI